MKTVNFSITFICVSISVLFCILVLAALVHTWFFNSGNHWFLFGTWVDRLLVRNRLICAITGALPMLLPLLFKISKQNVIVALSGIVVFLFLYASFYILGD